MESGFQLAVPEEPVNPVGGVSVAVEALIVLGGAELFQDVSCNAPPNRAKDTPVASATCVLRMRRFIERSISETLGAGYNGIVWRNLV